MLSARDLTHLSLTLVPAHLGMRVSPEFAAERFSRLLIDNYGPKARVAAGPILQATTLAEAKARMAQFCATGSALKGA